MRRVTDNELSQPKRPHFVAHDLSGYRQPSPGLRDSRSDLQGGFTAVSFHAPVAAVVRFAPASSHGRSSSRTIQPVAQAEYAVPISMDGDKIGGWVLNLAAMPSSAFQRWGRRLWPTLGPSLRVPELRHRLLVQSSILNNRSTWRPSMTMTQP
jgi:hypothetical protein